MLRVTLGTGAILVLLAATAVARVAPPQFQRPDSYRFAVNAITGDASYVNRFGTLPTQDTDGDLRIRTHLEYVHDLLSHRDVSFLPADLRAERTRNLERLRDYIDAGVFPRNFLYRDQSRPCFIDRDGRICAVGYLVEQSAGRAIAEQINAAHQSEFLWQMNSPVIDTWAKASGLSLLELSMIQPTYEPAFAVVVSTDGAAAPAVTRVQGRFIAGQYCDVGLAQLDWGDGTTWEHEGFTDWLDIDLTHTYTCPGTYMITATLHDAAPCRGVSTRQWPVSLDAPDFLPFAVVSKLGQPFSVYVRARGDIRYSYLTSQMINWGDGSDDEVAGWYLEGEDFRTATHEYPSAGPRTITITNGYDGDTCSFQHGISVIAPVGKVFAIETTTWGRVKAFYQ